MIRCETLAGQGRKRSQEGSGQLAEDRGIKGGELSELMLQQGPIRPGRQVLGSESRTPDFKDTEDCTWWLQLGI